MSTRKPEWLKIRIPGGQRYNRIRRTLKARGLHTVCEEARCPNLGECWEAGTATFMILGDTCTRGCRFCAVQRGDPEGRVDPEEPARVAAAAREMGLDYTVVTSVSRDDLPDGGAGQFAATVRALKEALPGSRVELLIPDYLGGDLDSVLAARPDVLAHNIEVVERLTPLLRHRRTSYRRSLEVLALARGEEVLTKSSILLGLGEVPAEVEQALADLRGVGVDILVLGQYLQPTRRHAPVAEFVHPDRFQELAARGRELGFGYVAAGPLVRTSYRAAEAYAHHRQARREA